MGRCVSDHDNAARRTRYSVIAIFPIEILPPRLTHRGPLARPGGSSTTPRGERSNIIHNLGLRSSGRPRIVHYSPMKLICLLFLCSTAAVFGVERATYDSAGGLTSIIQAGAELPLHGALSAQFTGGLRVSVQPHDQRTPITREESKLSWKGIVTFPNTNKTEFTADWSENPDTLTLQTSATNPGEFPLDLVSLDYLIDLPRPEFEGGKIGNHNATPFPSQRPADPVFFNQTTDQLSFENAPHSWKLTLKLDQPRPIKIVDIWDKTGRSYRIQITLHEGPLRAKTPVTFQATLTPESHPHAAAAHLRVDLAQPRYTFDGFGGNYCFNTQTPTVEYTLEQLPSAWARLEFKGSFWARERDHPGPQLKRDFELMQRVQRAGIPWILTLWRLPERFYIDPNQQPLSNFGRTIAPDRWPELLDLLTSYLAYLKKYYEAEPDYFSFNESDLGVSIGFTAETHREMIKRVGAHLVAAGVKTKLLLGDTANPRDSHFFVLPTAADAEAMKYVGAVSFHSWGNGTPAQYRSWADVGRWTGLPVIVGEAGTDPGSYRNRVFDSYAYGLKDALQYQELLRDAEPTAILYWQYTDDYGLVHKQEDGTIESTPRFWLMKQFVDFSPRKGQVVTSTSDQKDVAISALSKGDEVAVHLLNLGPEREATLDGLSSGPWKTITTTEATGLQSKLLNEPPTQLHLPARSLVTLVKTK